MKTPFAIKHLLFSTIKTVWPGEVGHLRRYELNDSTVIPPHDHDFFEIECGLAGTGIQNFNGIEQPFMENEIYLVRDSDVHEVHAPPGRKFALYNIAFETKHLRRFCDDYHLEFARRWMEDSTIPRRYRMSPMELTTIRQGLKEMLLDTKRAFALDRFLFNFLFLMERRGNTPYAACPEWLQQTIARLDEPQWLQMGPRALETISGYTLEHISRLLKKHAGILPRDLMNNIRMEHAAVCLTLGTKDIYGIIEECGLKSTSHFFRLFKQRYGCTPLQYRQQR